MCSSYLEYHGVSIGRTHISCVTGQESEGSSYMERLRRLGMPGPEKARVLEWQREKVVSEGP